MYTVDSNFVHTFAGNPLDRAQHLRKDQAALGALQRSDTSRFLVFHQLKVATNAAGSLASVFVKAFMWIEAYENHMRTGRPLSSYLKTQE